MTRPVVLEVQVGVLQGSLRYASGVAADCDLNNDNDNEMETSSE
jgi:hypothetical protein